MTSPRPTGDSVARGVGTNSREGHAGGEGERLAAVPRGVELGTAVGQRAGVVDQRPAPGTRATPIFALFILGPRSQGQNLSTHNLALALTLTLTLTRSPPQLDQLIHPHQLSLSGPQIFTDANCPVAYVTVRNPCL